MLPLKIARYLGGAIVLVAGVSVMLYGGYLSMFLTVDGGQPYYVEGYALCVAGLALTGLGVWLTGGELRR